jgi:hypothetical protein
VHSVHSFSSQSQQYFSAANVIIFLLVDPSWKQFVIHVQKNPKGLLLKNIVGTVKKSYAQNALNGIYFYFL